MFPTGAYLHCVVDMLSPKADFETEVANLRNRLKDQSPKGKTPQSQSTVEDHDMDADDESSGPSFRSKAPVDDISALLKQTLTDFLAEQANQPNNSSQGRKGKKQSSLKVGSVAYNRKVKKRGLAALSKEQEQKWRVCCVEVLMLQSFTFYFI